MSAVRRAGGPIALVVVLGLTLLVGSGVFDTPAPAAMTRVAALERIVKCPSCQDLSVAQSNAPSSVAVRREIVAQVTAGASDDAILNGLVARFGPSILLVPPAGGIDDVLWIVPVALACAAVAGGAVVVVRRRRPA